MNKNTLLSETVERFASLFLHIPDKDLGIHWTWMDHEEEIRFALFVTLQELRQLAVTLSTLRPQPTPAQRILSQYHAAYLDLQAAILGLSPEDAEKIPAEGEWNIRRTYAHILGGDVAFTAVVRYALEGHRAGTWKPDPMSDEDEARLVGMDEEQYRALTQGLLHDMLSYHRGFHPAILEDFSHITDTELDLPSTLWEVTRFPIRHRLHRYEAHYVQHTVQVDKTLTAIGQEPNESKRLIRKVYAALAEAEGMLIGVKTMDDTAIVSTASSIEERSNEISRLLSGSPA